MIYEMALVEDSQVEQRHHINCSLSDPFENPSAGSGAQASEAVVKTWLSRYMGSEATTKVLKALRASTRYLVHGT